MKSKRSLKLVEPGKTIALLYALLPMSAFAGLGPLAEEPLFLGASVQPNILFIVDDSGSMDWEVLKSNGALAVHGPWSNGGYLDPTPNDWIENLGHCVGYNVMAYDPTRTYTPWRGNNASGSVFKDASLATAYTDPYTNSTTDISNYFYYQWNDADKDGEYDFGECPYLNRTVTVTDCAGIAGCVPVNTLSAAEQVNYANWYSYYRKREFVVKRALSEIVTDSDARVGLATLHNNNSVGTLIEDVDDKTVPINATAQANKEKLLANLVKIDSNGGTPLRSTLESAGKYYTQGVNPGSWLFGFDAGSSSPILPATAGGSCQQNYSVLMTDGTWNGWDPSVGNADGDNSSQFDGSSYADTYSNTLADVAMKYYEGDLDPSLSNNVKIIAGVDENPAQHMVTYTVAFGLSGTVPLSVNPSDSNFPGWPYPDPWGNPETTIDDVRHAAYNGRGEYLSAENPQQLIDSLSASIAGIAKREGSASAVAFSSTSLQTDTKVFQGKFDSSAWFGDIVAFNISASGLGSIAWEADSLLSARNYSTRDIITFNGASGIPFKWPSSYTNPSSLELSTSQIEDLLADAPFPAATQTAAEITANADYGKQILAFLRGDFSNEKSLFRDRAGHRLGDVIYSSPEYMGAPRENYSDAIEPSSFRSFKSSYSARKGIVYVGANDGMLHAFNANTGDEIFAYVPGFVFSSKQEEGLHYLADKLYGYHPYVDGTPKAASVFVNSKWRTFLVGGARAGGRGIYVLDVTDPSSLTETNADNIVQFEFTDPDLGYTFSKPVIAKMNNGRWAAIVGNGYHANGGDGTAKVFIIYLDNAAPRFTTLETKVGSIVGGDCLALSSQCNGMSGAAVVDITGDGVADRIFAGDLEGNLWAFDVTDQSESNWRSAYPKTGTPAPLFSSPGEPITETPAVGLHPTRSALSTAPNLMVYFGTGQYMAKGDNTSSPLNAFYGIWDNGISYNIDQSMLKEQLITNKGVSRDITDYKVAYSLSGMPLELGWFEELPTSRERSVTSASVRNDIVFYNTLIPDASTCSYGGSGYLMAVDAETGGLPSHSVFDYNKDGVYDDVGGVWIDGIPSESGYISGKKITQVSDGTIDIQDLRSPGDPKVNRTSLSIDPK